MIARTSTFQMPRMDVSTDAEPPNQSLRKHHTVPRSNQVNSIHCALKFNDFSQFIHTKVELYFHFFLFSLRNN